MNIKKIEKIAKAYEEIKMLQDEVIALDKMAIQIINDDKMLSVKLSVENQGGENETNFSDQDPDTIIARRKAMYESMMLGFFPQMYTTEEHSSSTVEFKCFEEGIPAVEIIGILIRVRKSEIENLINFLEKES